MKTKNNIKLIILLALIISLALSASYAYLKWSSSRTNVTFNIESCDIVYNAGVNISGKSFGPALSKDDTNNVISKDISMTPECSDVTARLTLKVVSIDDELKDSSFVWELYDKNDTTTPVSSGNFASATTDTVYTLLDTTTLTNGVTSKYTLYIYINGNLDNPSTMGGKSFNFILGASGENAVLKDSYTIMGNLLDSSNNPIPNATITVHSDPITTTTDSEGKYVLYDVPVGDHTIEVKNNANTVIASGNFSLSKGSDYTSTNNNLTISNNSVKQLNITTSSSKTISKYEWGSVKAVDLVKTLDDGTSGDNGNGVYKVHHDEISSTDSVTGEVIPAVDDYRYYGANPDNYICLDYEGSTTCPDKHLYRIIGSIYDELASTNRLKLKKATPLTDGTVNTFAWDYDSSGTSKNIWAAPTDTRNNIIANYSNETITGSYLMMILNAGIWWSDDVHKGKVYDYYNKSGISVDFTNYKLSSTAKGLVGDTRYYLAGHNTSEITTTTMYTYERTRTGYRNGRYNDSRPYYWEGKIALMYPSDYGYAAGKTCATGTNLSDYKTSCKNMNWLIDTSKLQWLLTPSSSVDSRAFAVASPGNVVDNVDGTRSGSFVYPTFYLNKDIMITGGTGTSSNPYTVSN